MVKTVYESDNTNSVKGKRLDWIDQMKAIAIIWIILNHIIERLFGSPYIANPSANWPPLAERIAQLQPLEGHGFWDIFLNSLRYLGWAGDQGVQLFLILSGFSLTWSLLNRKDKGSIALGEFYRRRLGRIYPMWWGVHLVFIVSWMLIGWGLPLTDKAVYLSLIGFRITPSLFYYFAPAWWFIGLLIQLYLIYPVLWKGLQRRGPLWLLGVSCGVAFAVRAIGLLWFDGYFDGYLDAWQRGAIFITRLPEFVFGISLAAWLYRSPSSTDERLRKPSTLLLAVVFYSLGTVLALTLLGMAIAPFLLGVGTFVLLYAALTIRDRSTTSGVGLWQWVGRHSYSLFLIHHPLIVRLIPTELAGNNFRVLVGIAAALLLTVVGAIALEWAVGVGSALVGSWYKHFGITRAALSVVGFAAI
ncbi:MAG TPA: acyltransferase, partial [Cyanophyceae cyanobacterium]